MHPAMHRLLLALVLGMLWSEMKLESEARTPPYGVKLCGREFVRAVIFTCGGSRWRRADSHHVPDLSPVDSVPPDLPPQGLKEIGDLGGLPGGESTEAFIETSSSNEWDSIRVSPKDSSDYVGSWRRHSPSEETWAVDRGTRDVMAGLSSACCKWGCSKSEISSLC